MDKIEKIRTKIDRMLDDICEADGFVQKKDEPRYDALAEVLDFLDALEEEPDKNLEEAAEEHVKSKYCLEKLLGAEIKEAVNDFIAGAKWYEEQFEKNHLAHCDAVSEEDCNRETDFAMEIIEKEHRHPTFTDAINYGMRLQEKQMGEQARQALAKTDITLADLVAFDEGLKLGRRLERQDMMKGAVEADVNTYEDLVAGKSWAEFVVDMPINNLGDKVKLIIVKED